MGTSLYKLLEPALEGRRRAKKQVAPVFCGDMRQAAVKALGLA